VEQVALQTANSNSNITTMRKALAIMWDDARTDGLRRLVRDEPNEIAPELTGHGLPLSKCEAYNRVYDQFYQSC
jgi:hypothetical protein